MKGFVLYGKPPLAFTRSRAARSFMTNMLLSCSANAPNLPRPRFSKFHNPHNVWNRSLLHMRCE